VARQTTVQPVASAHKVLVATSPPTRKRAGLRTSALYEPLLSWVLPAVTVPCTADICEALLTYAYGDHWRLCHTNPALRSCGGRLMVAWSQDLVGRLRMRRRAHLSFFCSYKGCIQLTIANHLNINNHIRLPPITRLSLRTAKTLDKPRQSPRHPQSRQNSPHKQDVHNNASRRYPVRPRHRISHRYRSPTTDRRHTTLPYRHRDTTPRLHSSIRRTLPDFCASPSPCRRQVRLPRRWPTCVQRTRSVGSMQLGKSAISASRCWHTMSGRRDRLCTRLWYKCLRRTNTSLLAVLGGLPG
jgi:hypothetical protein